MSLLERENIILRHWAGVLPATRVLLGRGPTGCDTAKPLIADENDEELQLIMDDSSPRDGNWPETPTARTSYVMEHQHQQQQQQQHHHHHIPDTVPQSLSNNPQANHTSMPGPPQYEKGPGAYDQPYPELQRFKPHPLYSHRPLESYVPPPPLPPPPPHFEQNSSSIPTSERLLVKRESIYATPDTSALVPQHSQGPPQQQQQTLPAGSNHPSISHSSGFYAVPHRSSYTLDNRYTSIHTDLNGNSNPGQSMYSQSTWSDPYLQQPPTPVQGNRRPHPTLMTPVMPTAGPSSGSVSSSSPASQSASHPNADPRVSGNVNMNGGGGGMNTSGGANGNVAADPAYTRGQQQQHSMSYALNNGSAVNLANLNGNNGSQVNLNGNSVGSGQASMTSSGYPQQPPSSSSAPFGSYHTVENPEAASENFRQ